MWIKPWKLTEGFIIGSGLVLTGLLLQLTVGPIDWSTFAWPVNLIVLVAFLAIALTAHLLRKRVYACQWLGSHDAAITSISWAVVLTLIMGLTRQSAGINPHGDRSLLEVVGITQCLTWWPFALIYTWLTLSLALAVFRRASVLTLRNIPFMVMHTGLLVVLLCGTLGSADMQRLKMMTRQGVPEWRATDDKGNLIELDVAIDLKSFTIDEYPPKLMMADIATGDALPKGKPQHIMLDSVGAQGDLMGWNVKVIKSFTHAAAMIDSTAVNYVEWHSFGATTAALVEVTKGNTRITDWVSCGNFMFPSKELKLDSAVCLFMPEPEPLRYASAVNVYTQAGTNLTDTITVNRPLTVEKWKIYQLDYDREMGRWSETSVFELVTDPWLYVVYAGIGLLLLGAVLMFMIPATPNTSKE